MAEPQEQVYSVSNAENKADPEIQDSDTPAKNSKRTQPDAKYETETATDTNSKPVNGNEIEIQMSQKGDRDLLSVDLERIDINIEQVNGSKNAKPMKMQNNNRNRNRNVLKVIVFGHPQIDILKKLCRKNYARA